MRVWLLPVHQTYRCVFSGGFVPNNGSIGEKINILSFALASDAGDRTTPVVSDQRDCPPPPPALLTQDSMPRERRHLAGVTWEGGLVVLFLFLLSGECSLGAHGLLRFRTNDVLLGTSGVGVCVSVVSNSPGNVLRVLVAEWTLPLDHHLLCFFGRRPLGGRVASGSNRQL